MLKFTLLLYVPLTLQHGKALAYVIHCHFKKLIREVVKILRMTGYD